MPCSNPNAASADLQWHSEYDAAYNQAIALGLSPDQARRAAYGEAHYVSPYGDDAPLAEDSLKRRLIADAWKHKPAGLPDPIAAVLAANPRDAQAAFQRAATEASKFEKKRDNFIPRQIEAEAQFLEDCIEMTGDAVDEKKAQKKRRERKTLDAQSYEIAQTVWGAGLDLFRPDNCQFWRYYIHTKHWEPLIQYRRCTFIPSVAQMTRAPILAALEYFLQNERGKYCRFWTFTSGTRCITAQLKSRISKQHKELKELAKELRARYGVEFILRSTELGTPEFNAEGDAVAEREAGNIEFDAEGNPLWHVHTHIVARSIVGYIQPDKWAEMYEFIGARWKHYWNGGSKKGKDGTYKNGVIKNARECVKYMTKPGDVLALSGVQMRALYEATSRMKMVQPLGTLKTEIRDRKKSGATLRRYRLKNGEVKWRERIDNNKQAPTHPNEREALKNLEDSINFERELRLTAKVPPGTPIVAHEMAPFCRVIARMAPSMGQVNYKEPSVIVMGTHKDQRAVETHPLVESMVEATFTSWVMREVAADVKPPPYNSPHGHINGGKEQRCLEFEPDADWCPFDDSGQFPTLLEVKPQAIFSLRWFWRGCSLAASQVLQPFRLRFVPFFCVKTLTCPFSGWQAEIKQRRKPRIPSRAL